MRQFPPSRIVCLTEETVETLYLLGEQDRIVGVSGYAVRPPQVRREKPRVSAFTSADIPKIRALEPDLVLTFSDLQAEIAAELIGAVGGTESLICHPTTTVHSGLTEEARREIGITPALIRMSIGIEHPDDLVADITQAFA